MVEDKYLLPLHHHPILLLAALHLVIGNSAPRALSAGIAAAADNTLMMGGLNALLLEAFRLAIVLLALVQEEDQYLLPLHQWEAHTLVAM